MQENHLNPNKKSTSVVLENSNMTASFGTPLASVLANKGVTDGKWYWEVHVGSGNTTGTIAVGIAKDNISFIAGTYTAIGSVRSYLSHGRRLNGASMQVYGDIYQTGDTISIMLDMDIGSIEFLKNNVSQGVFYTDLKPLGEVFPLISGYESSKATIAFLKEDMKYSPPDGYEPYSSPPNKSFILFGDGYKKLSEGSPATISDVNAIPKMTSNTVPNGSASASSVFGVGFEAWRAFDKVLDATGHWISSATLPHWISYKFNSPKAIVKIKIKNRANSLPEQSMKNFSIQGRNEGGGWFDLKIVVNEPIWSTGEERFYDFINIETFEEYRVICTSTHGGAYLTITEIEMFEVETPATPPTWKTVSPTLPTLPQFQSEGMDDLSIFDRKVQAVLESPQAMTSSVLGEGKVFKGTVDLKKIFDLRKLEVK